MKERDRERERREKLMLDWWNQLEINKLES